MALTKKQVNQAARLYGLAMAAHTDGDDGTDDAQRVMKAARDQAEAALAALGYDKNELLSAQDCVTAVQNR